MSRTSVKVLALVAIVVAMAIVAFALLGGGSDGNTGGPAELPAAEDGTGGVPSDAPSEEETASADPAAVDASLTAQDPVPDGVVSALFALIEAEGGSPLMEETYTVEFVETTDKVRIKGEFEDGPAEYRFEHEDAGWKVVQDDE